MSAQSSREVQIQKQYYAETAHHYNEMHVNEKDEHFFALSFMVSTFEQLEIRSILDIGSGTGRAIRYVQQKCPDIRMMGIEPVNKLREIGYSQGISEEQLADGDANDLQFTDKEFDLVCEFGMLHHVRTPKKVISEMLRVGNKAIFISDVNNFGQGSLLSRTVKQIINAFGIWKLADLIKTKGKGYTISEGDGLGYSYSVFNNYKQIRSQCERIHFLNTNDGSFNLYRSASHVALLAIKKV